MVTALAAVFVSVEFSILIGVALSILMFVPRAARITVTELTVGADRFLRDRQPDDPCCNRMVILDLEGELFFGAAPELDRYFAELKQKIKAGLRIIVLRVKRTRNPDMVCMERFQHFLRDMEQKAVTVLLCGVRADFDQAMKNLHFYDWLPAERVFRENAGAPRLRDLGRGALRLRSAGRRRLRRLPSPQAGRAGERGALLRHLTPQPKGASAPRSLSFATP